MRFAAPALRCRLLVVLLLANLAGAPGGAAPVTSGAGPVGGVEWSPDPAFDSDSSDLVAPQAPATCITPAHPCVVVPVTIARNTSDPMRAFSVTLQLSSNLALCDSGVVEGPYLAGAGFTHFEVRNRGAGLYTVDCVIMGLPCGATAPSGTLFTVRVGSSAPSATGAMTLTNLILRDCDNHPISGAMGGPASITIDNLAPYRITALAAAQLRSGNDLGGTTDITVSWPTVETGASVEVYRAGYGNYPEYDDPPGAGSVPGTPSYYPPGSPWVLLGSVTGGASLVDTPGARGFWYYVAFVKDACGNSSAVSNKTAGTLNYHLGDVHNGLTACAGNNMVSTEDVSFLGAHYGATLGTSDPLGCLDVGPTTDLSVNTRPMTDDVLDFEDLMMFALNWHLVSAPGLMAAPVPATQDRIWLEGPVSVKAGETFAVVLSLEGAGDLQGISAQLDWNRAMATPVSMEVGSLVSSQGGVVFSARPGSVDAAVLGGGRAFTGEGVLATVTFRALRTGAPQVVLAALDARDAGNRKVTLAGVKPQAPVVTAFAAPMPNPFSRTATLSFGLARAGEAELAIYTVEGRKVATLASGAHEAGEYRLVWDGAGMRPGLYYARLTTPEGRFTRTLVLTR